MICHRSLAAALALSSALSACATQTAAAGGRLEEQIRVRTAGEPERCILLERQGRSEIIARSAIAWQVGSTIYLNRPAAAETLDPGATLVTTSIGSQLCAGETVRLVDPGSGMTTAILRLGPFIPYRRAGSR